MRPSLSGEQEREEFVTGLRVIGVRLSLVADRRLSNWQLATESLSLGQTFEAKGRKSLLHYSAS